MKQGPVYTIVFLFLLTAVFTAALAIADEAFAPTIAQNQALALKKDVLSAFGLDTSGDAAAVEARFTANVQARTTEAGLAFYAQVGSEGADVGYAVPFVGSGLWGTIRGYLAVSVAGDRILGIVFTEQQETPGLGGRIDEKAYKDQFRGIAIASGTKLAYGVNGDKELDAVTGATITSNAVMRIVNDTLENVVPDVVPAVGR